jgi:MFS transporter, Spinster family, sphingosine-1-phosphate transporter
MATPTPSPEAPVAERYRFPSPIGGALFALAVLFFMNLLNYVDRYVFSSLGVEIEQELGINHAKFGTLASAFMVVYTFVSPCVGWMGDRYNRRRLLAVGVGLWSLATVGTSFAHTFWQMFLWRALLGVGEASYGVVAPTLLADLFNPKARGRVMGIFYLALPLGGALGYGIGGFVGTHWGWRHAFWVVGVPGLLAAAAALMIHDPGRGASEADKPAGKADRPRMRDYRLLFKTPSFVLNILGMAAVTFALGAYANFGAIFYQEVRGMKLNEASYSIGILTAIAGLVGIVMGTGLADLLLKFTRRAYLLWSSLAVAIAVPFAGAAILIPQRGLSFGMLFGAMVLLASVLGPCNTVTANVVPATQRAAGYAVSIFLIHILGDIFSPLLIGFLSDWSGRPAIVESPIGWFLLTLGAKPTSTGTGFTNLTAGMLSVIPMLAVGAVFFWIGSRHLADDQDRARRLSRLTSVEDPTIH